MISNIKHYNSFKDMTKKQYQTPLIKVFSIRTETLLTNTSPLGGEIGQFGDADLDEEKP
uniref:Uncharacterized protein n=1 Tax=Prevotella sp. GTC17253 TaxID=3236793 RepID=A0AB33IT91_9BACT